jgi:peptidyl-prolyl cis-trans isomerase SurA
MQLAKDTPGARRARSRTARAITLSAGLLSATALVLAAGGAVAQGLQPIQTGPEAAVEPVLREGVAAVVNNDIISTYDVRQRILLLIVSSGVRPTEESLPQLEREALRDLVDESLQLQEIQRIESTRDATIQPTDEEIDEEISGLARQNNLTGQQLLASLASAGVDPQTLRRQIRAESAWRRYVGGAFGSSVTVSDDQVNAQMQRLAAAANKPQYLVAEILIDSQRAGGPEQAVEGARQLIAQISQGAPFQAVARQFSAASTAAAGGDAGWVGVGELPQPVEQALEQLRPGQLSEPIPVSGGVYVVMLRDKRAGSDATLVDLKQAAVRLPPEPTEAEIAAARATLEQLKPRLNSCANFEQTANGVSGVVAGSLGETDLNDLSETFKTAISGLQANQVSAPVRSEAGLHLVAVCGRRAAGAAAPTRSDIHDRLVEQELSMISRRELRDLRNSANIENK